MTYLSRVYVLRCEGAAEVIVHGGRTGAEVRLVPFSRVRSVRHVELARRACRIVGGPDLQRQVTRAKVKGVWITPDESDEPDRPAVSEQQEG